MSFLFCGNGGGIFNISGTYHTQWVTIGSDMMRISALFRRPPSLAGYILFHHGFPQSVKGFKAQVWSFSHPIPRHTQVLKGRLHTVHERFLFEEETASWNKCSSDKQLLLLEERIFSKTANLENIDAINAKESMDIHKQTMRDQRHSSCRMPFQANGRIQDPQVSHWSICRCKKPRRKTQVVECSGNLGGSKFGKTHQHIENRKTFCSGELWTLGSAKSPWSFFCCFVVSLCFVLFQLCPPRRVFLLFFLY